MNSRSSTAWLVLAAAIIGLASAPAIALAAAPNEVRNSVRNFMASELKQFRDADTRFVAAAVPIGKSGKQEILVYITGSNWCGSGGCRLWILDPVKDSYRIIGEVTIVHLPVRVLNTSTNGRPDLGIWVQGGGIIPSLSKILCARHNMTNRSMYANQEDEADWVGKASVAQDTEGAG